MIKLDDSRAAGPQVVIHGGLTTAVSAVSLDDLEGWFVSEEAAPSYAKHLKFCMDVGLVNRARQISSVLSKDNLRCPPGVEEALKETLSWLVNAEASERLHGLGTMLNTNHPKWIAARVA